MPTVAGKKMEKHSDLFIVQWESMKKFYKKPITQIVMPKFSISLLQTSGRFSDEAPRDGWDEGGANAQQNDDAWDDEE